MIPIPYSNHFRKSSTRARETVRSPGDAGLVSRRSRPLKWRLTRRTDKPVEVTLGKKTQTLDPWGWILY